MTAVYFEGENKFKEMYQRDGLAMVLDRVHDELEDIQALTCTVAQSLKGKEHNEHLVSYMATDKASELQDMLEILKEHLCITGQPAILEMPNSRRPFMKNKVGCAA